MKGEKTYGADQLQGELMGVSENIRIVRFNLGSKTFINWQERRADFGQIIFLYVFQHIESRRIVCATLAQEESPRFRKEDGHGPIRKARSTTSAQSAAPASKALDEMLFAIRGFDFPPPRKPL